jgi:hypothetical protein
VGELPLTMMLPADPQRKGKKCSFLKLVSILKYDVLAKRKLHIMLFLAASLQFALFYIAYSSHYYHKTVQLNRLTLSRGTDPPPENAWWRGQNLTIWTIWIGDNVLPPPLIQAAMQSCRTVHQHEPHLSYQVITNDDLNTLDFDLHPSFWLLDNVEKSDYLRAELLHHYGGFYMDADVLCLQSFSTALLRTNYTASAAQDRTHYGPWPSVSQNALGPFQPHSPLTSAWHELLMTAMDNLTPQLQKCANDHAPHSIPYPNSRWHGTSMCGVPWGGVIDFVKPLWLEYFAKRQLGHELNMCNVRGQHLGWDDLPPHQCDIVHLGTAGDFFQHKQWNMETLCQKLPVMKHSPHCTRSTSSSEVA